MEEVAALYRRMGHAVWLLNICQSLFRFQRLPNARAIVSLLHRAVHLRGGAGPRMNCHFRGNTAATESGTRGDPTSAGDRFDMDR